jgi:hypothetical protein
MSVALWCDAGEHAFSSKDPKKKVIIDVQEKENRYGDIVETREEFNMCGPCQAKTGLFQGNTTKADEKAIQGKVAE